MKLKDMNWSSFVNNSILAANYQFKRFQK